MRTYVGLIVLILCIAGASRADVSNKVTDTEAPQTETTKTVPAKKTTTEVPTTTVAPTTATEPTTTPKPEPTTETTVVTTESTTSTTEATTTTQAPTPQVGSWNVTDDQDNTTVCIRARMAVQIEIRSESLNLTHALSPNATAAGSCHPQDNETQVLALLDVTTMRPYTLTLIFAQNAHQTFVRNITVSWSTEPGDQAEMNGNFFTMTTGKSYKCNQPKPLVQGNVTLLFSSVQIQAFGQKGNTGFGDAEDCESDTMDSIVPIAVAAALAAMVIIILISYLVFRRQSRQRGYESM